MSSTFAVTWCYFQYARCGRKDNIAYSTLMGAWSFEHLKIAFLQYMFEWHPPLRSWCFLQYTRRGSKDNTAYPVFYYNLFVSWIPSGRGVLVFGPMFPVDCQAAWRTSFCLNSARESAMSHRPCDSKEDTGAACSLGWETPRP